MTSLDKRVPHLHQIQGKRKEIGYLGTLDEELLRIITICYLRDNIVQVYSTVYMYAVCLGFVICLGHKNAYKVLSVTVFKDM